MGGLKAVKRYQAQLRETIQAYEDTARSHAAVSEQVGISERKAAALGGEVEESKALLDGADRATKQLGVELNDARTAASEMSVINARELSGKRTVEGMIHTAQAEIDSMLQAAKNAEEKSKRAMVDAARLADELALSKTIATPTPAPRTHSLLSCLTSRIAWLMQRLLP